MDNTTFARRMVALIKRIERMYPWPTVDYDYDKWPWKVADRKRQRAIRRITDLPARWKLLPK